MKKNLIAVILAALTLLGIPSVHAATQTATTLPAGGVSNSVASLMGRA
jgi:hypothetical protein